MEKNIMLTDVLNNYNRYTIYLLVIIVIIASVSSLLKKESRIFNLLITLCATFAIENEIYFDAIMIDNAVSQLNAGMINWIGIVVSFISMFLQLYLMVKNSKS